MLGKCFLKRKVIITEQAPVSTWHSRPFGLLEVNTTFLQLKCDKGPLFLEPCDDVKAEKKLHSCVYTTLLGAIALGEILQTKRSSLEKFLLPMGHLPSGALESASIVFPRFGIRYTVQHPKPVPCLFISFKMTPLLLLMKLTHSSTIVHQYLW